MTARGLEAACSTAGSAGTRAAPSDLDAVDLIINPVWGNYGKIENPRPDLYIRPGRLIDVDGRATSPFHQPRLRLGPVTFLWMCYPGFRHRHWTKHGFSSITHIWKLKIIVWLP